MASTFYMKLYYEVIDDPKMGRMSDHDWRRCLEFFMLAGEFDHDGYLPEIKDLAWRLRTTEEKIQKNLDFLCEKDKNIITKTKDGYLITNFIKRQKRISDAERMDAYRERKRISDENATEVQRERYEVVTSRNTDIDIDLNKDKDKDKIKKNAQPTDNKSFVGEFLEKSGLKSLASNDQGYEIIEFRDTYGADKVMSAALWIKDKKITNIKKALSSLRTALPTWTTAIPKESAPKRMYKDPDGNVVMI